VLGGANTYGGGTAINGGVLQISADNNLGDAAGGLTFDGGTLRTTSTFSTGRTFTLDAGGGTIETNSTTELTITSAIGEAGGARALTKAGGGDLILTGASTYTGGTNIDAGRLILGNGGATGSISSTGGIAIASGAVLMFFRNDATTISNDISGEGTVHQRGIGTTTLSGTNTYSGVTDIQFGRLIAAGSGVGDSSDVFVDGPGVFEITSDETIGSLGGSGSVELNANTLTLGGGSANSVVFNGVITGAGGVVKDGAYTQTFNNNQDYQGSTTIDGGTLLVNGTLRDAVIVNSGATFGGNASIIENDNLFSNSGNVSPGNSPGTINVAGDYITSGAPTLTVDVFANQVNAPVNGTTHDFFSVGDDVIGVDTRILLDFSLNSGAPVATTGNGIEIVRVGDVSQTDDFFLSTAVQTGPQGLANGFIGGFQYLVNALQGSGPGGSDQFFLRTVVREELVANATILAAGRQVSRDCFRGPEHTQNGENKGKTRAWVNGRYGTFESDASNGADFDSDYTCVTGGVDTQVGDGFTLGLRGGYATQDVDLTVVQGVANLHGDTWTFEAALSYANNEGYYSGMTFGYRSTDWEYRHALASGGTSSADVDGVVGSLHAGYRNNLGGNATLGLEGAVLYDATDCDANCILAGTVEDTSDWEARIAARYDAVWGAVQPYALLSVSHNFGDGQTVSFGNAISEVDTASALLGLNLGLSADVGEGWALSAEVATTQGLDSEVAGYQGTLGLRKTW
jgi:autotransporter-associated beta strand protein